MLPLARGKVSKPFKELLSILLYIMSIPWYHLRVSVDDADSANGVIEHLLASFPIEKYIFGYEEKDENKHFHGHIQYDPTFDPTLPKNKVKRSEFFRKMKKLEFVPDKTEASYHEVCRDEFKNLSYVIKECHVLKSYGIDEDILEEAKNYSARVENEKNMPMKEQLLQAWSWRKRLFLDKMEAFMFIDEYHVSRDYLPPNFTNKIQYALYIVYKSTHTSDIIHYYSLIASLNGIRDTDYNITEHNRLKEIDRDLYEQNLDD